MTGYTLLALVLVIFLYQETSQQHHLDKLKMSAIIHNFKRLLSSRIFMGITFSTFLTYGAMFSWLSAGPILLIHVVKVTPLVFGLLTFFAGGIAYALAGWVNGKLVLRFGMTNMMRLGWTFALIAGILMLIGKFLFGINVWAIIIPIILFYFGSTLIWPNAFAGAFTPFGDIAGYAGALYSFMQLGGGAVIGTVMAYLPAHNQIPLAWVMIICSLLAWFIYEMIPRPVLAPPKNA
jgi:DHA1 family bicyclomycin/chloramphenicol resistance-like MFS transporter/DHA1 family 2-module integral membrane pump EmrD-like MFS transporter